MYLLVLFHAVSLLHILRHESNTSSEKLLTGTASFITCTGICKSFLNIIVVNIFPLFLKSGILLPLPYAANNIGIGSVQLENISFTWFFPTYSAPNILVHKIWVLHCVYNAYTIGSSENHIVYLSSTYMLNRGICSLHIMLYINYNV